MHLLYKCIAYLAWITFISAQTEDISYDIIEPNSPFDVEFKPKKLDDLKWTQTAVVSIHILCNESIFANNINTTDTRFGIRYESSHSEVAKIVEASDILDLNCSAKQQIRFHVQGHRLGHSTLYIHIYSANDEFMISHHYDVTVQNEKTILNDIFIAVVAGMMIILSFSFGCRMHVGDLKQILRRPVAPVIGICCQFVIMPLLGIALTQILGMDELLGFGLFVVACSPGGGGSNVWTVMLDGDLDLSMTMTLFSKTLGLGFMPTWLYIGGGLYGEISVQIPYRNLIIGLASIAIPCLSGIALLWWKPKIAKYVSKTVKFIAALFVVWLIVVGSVSNYYVFPIMFQAWYILPGALLLPYLGVCLGLTIAKLAGQPKMRVITIGIETGVQDTGIAILLLLSSFGRPNGSIAATIPIASAMATPIPFAIAAIFLTVRKKCWRAGKCSSCGGPESNCDKRDEAEMLNADNVTFAGALMKGDAHSYNKDLDGDVMDDASVAQGNGVMREENRDEAVAMFRKTENAPSAENKI